MSSFYNGYILTRGKKPLMSFKDAELLTLEEVQNFPSYAGVLSNDTVLIDIDDQEQSDILFNIVKDKQLKCKVIATSRGKHFLFWNNGQIKSNKTHAKLAIGLIADIKGCGKASYQVLKLDNLTRDVLYDPGEYQTIPKWLTPVKTNFELFQMASGDGRNNALFSYILPLQQNEFSVEECRETIHIINDYVLKEPLSELELSGVLRDAAFNKPTFFTAHGGFQFDKFARYLQRTHNVVKINGKLHVYQDGYYQSGDSQLELAMIQEIPTLNQSKRKEVLAYLNLIIPNNSLVADAYLIAFKNGVLNAITMEMYDFSPEYIITNMIPHNWNPDAQNDLLERTMNKLACDDEQVLKLLYQAVGVCMHRRNELRKSFFLVGEKRNGKSTFLDMVSTLLGEENIANLDLSEIGDKFKTAELAGKLANIGDDINDEYIPNSSIFKKVVSGDVITVERKGQDPFKLASYAKFFFSANSLPRIGRGKDSSAVLDRLVVIPFEAKFSKDDPDYDPFIKYKLRDEEVIEALIVKAVEGLREVLADQEFSTCDRVKTKMLEYERTNNPILLFFDDLEEKNYINEPVKDVYRSYTSFCISNRLEPVSAIEFGKQFRKHFNVKVKDVTVDKQRVRIYVKEFLDG